MTKWEYCVLKGADDNHGGGFDPYYPSLIYFGPGGLDTVLDLTDKAAKSRPQEFVRSNQAVYVAHTIARLGLEGWEMVSAVAMAGATSQSPVSLYFRRPIQE